MNFFGLVLCISLSLTCGLGLEALLKAIIPFERQGAEIAPSEVAPAKENAFPHLISLEVYDEDRHHWWSACTGAMVSLTKVLTSASCYSSHSKHKSWQLVAGRYTLYTPREDEQIRGIRSIHVHPAFNNSEPTKPLYDYVIIVVNATFKVTRSVKPIALASPDFILPRRKRVTAVGWLLTSDAENKLGMQAVNQTHFSTQSCRGIYQKTRYDVPDNVLCAGKQSDEIPRNDLRGAPTVYNDTLIGISTLPFMRDYPSLLSNVSTVIPWIEQLNE